MSQLRTHYPERDAYLDRLAQHYADGLLDDAGFEARRDVLLQATTPGEMLRAFDGLPRPRYRDDGQAPGGRLGRRALVLGIGGVAALAAGGFVFGGRLGAPVQVEPVPSPIEVYDEPFATAAPAWLDHSILDEVLMTLQERGLTLVSEFNFGTAGASGVAMSPRAPGESRTFSKSPERPVVVSEAVPGEVPPAVEVDRFQEMLWISLDRGAWDFGEEGVVDGLELVFTERGNPTVRVSARSMSDDRALGTAQYDADGGLMALEENP